MEIMSKNKEIKELKAHGGTAKGLAKID